MSSWTEDRIEKLRVMHKLGHSASQIAKALGGVSRNACIGKAHRLGLGPIGGGRAVTPSAGRRFQIPVTATLRKPMPKGVMVLPPLKGGSCTEMATANRAANVEARVNPAPNVVRMDRAFSPLPGHEPVPFGSKGCKWPVSGEGAEMLQCGCAVDIPPYCDEHKATSRQQVQPKARTGNQLARSLRRYTA